MAWRSGEWALPWPGAGHGPVAVYDPRGVPLNPEPFWGSLGALAERFRYRPARDLETVLADPDSRWVTPTLDDEELCARCAHLHSRGQLRLRPRPTPSVHPEDFDRATD